MINAQQQYFTPDGRPTIAGLQLLGDQARRIAVLEAKLKAISEVDAPTGGATQDAEARAAVNDILDAAS